VLDKVGDLRSVHDPLRTPTVRKGDPSTPILLSGETLFVTVTIRIGLIIEK